MTVCVPKFFETDSSETDAIFTGLDHDNWIATLPAAISDARDEGGTVPRPTLVGSVPGSTAFARLSSRPASEVSPDLISPPPDSMSWTAR